MSVTELKVASFVNSNPHSPSTVTPLTCPHGLHAAPTRADVEASPGPVPPVVPACGRGVRVHHQLPRVLHGAGRQQSGHGVSEAAQ